MDVYLGLESYTKKVPRLSCKCIIILGFAEKHQTLCTILRGRGLGNPSNSLSIEPLLSSPLSSLDSHDD